jgi:hypothetical protein
MSSLSKSELKREEIWRQLLNSCKQNGASSENKTAEG